MRKTLTSLFTAFLLLGFPAWAVSDETEAKNCIYTIEDHRVPESERKIPVVCSPPVNIHDLIGRSREHVELILGPRWAFKAKKQVNHNSFADSCCFWLNGLVDFTLHCGRGYLADANHISGRKRPRNHSFWSRSRLYHPIV